MMNKRGLSVVLILVIVLVLAGGAYFLITQTKTTPNTGNNGTQTPAPAGASNAVEISNFAFSPASLTINAGDTVTWTNLDSTAHTITSDTGTELASEHISSGGTFSHTFASAGTYDYHCSIHLSMKGKIIVQ